MFSRFIPRSGITLLSSIVTFFSDLVDFAESLGRLAEALTQRETWIRIALVALGILLILVVLWPR